MLGCARLREFELGVELVWNTRQYVSLEAKELVTLDSWSDPIGGSEPVSGCETIYWDSLLIFFFPELNLYLWVYKQFL